jgi:hypothetical protein
VVANDNGAIMIDSWMAAAAATLCFAFALLPLIGLPPRAASCFYSNLKQQTSSAFKVEYPARNAVVDWPLFTKARQTYGWNALLKMNPVESLWTKDSNLARRRNLRKRCSRDLRDRMCTVHTEFVFSAGCAVSRGTGPENVQRPIWTLRILRRRVSAPWLEHLSFHDVQRVKRGVHNRKGRIVLCNAMIEE